MFLDPREVARRLAEEPEPPDPWTTVPAMKVYPTPSSAIAHGACAVCLGGGETLDIVLDRLGPCSGCGGSGRLDDMLARQCDDPDCVEHHHRRDSELRRID